MTPAMIITAGARFVTALLAGRVRLLSLPAASALAAAMSAPALVRVVPLVSGVGPMSTGMRFGTWTRLGARRSRFFRLLGPRRRNGSAQLRKNFLQHDNVETQKTLRIITLCNLIPGDNKPAH